MLKPGVWWNQSLKSWVGDEGHVTFAQTVEQIDEERAELLARYERLGVVRDRIVCPVSYGKLRAVE